MMKIMLNGDQRNCADGISVAGLLRAAGYEGRRVAVEVNRVIVPRSLCEQHVLVDGDRVEIIHAMGGG